MANVNPNALQIVQQVRANHPDLVGLEKFIPFLEDLCAQLNDGSGLLQKDGGENIVYYPPKGVSISISRVCYSDGTIAKVLSDAGPSPESTNGATWNYPEDTVDPNRYLQIIGDPIEPPVVPPIQPPSENPDLIIVVAMIQNLSEQIVAMQTDVTYLKTQLDKHMHSQTYSDTILGNLKLVLHPDPVL